MRNEKFRYVFQNHEMVVKEGAFALEEIPERFFAALFVFAARVIHGDRLLIALVVHVLIVIAICSVFCHC